MVRLETDGQSVSRVSARLSHSEKSQTPGTGRCDERVGGEGDLAKGHLG